MFDLCYISNNSLIFPHLTRLKPHQTPKAAIMHFSTLSFLSAIAATANAATIQVAVGQNGLTYLPNDIKAAVGDSVEFSFFPKNHTVTQSSFAQPCHPLANGFFSSFVPTTSSPSGTTFTILVNDTKPIWLYCGQTTGNHCQSGMVAAINAPTTGNTLAAFVALAKNATTSTSPPGSAPVGGILKVAGANSSSSSVVSSSKTVTATVATLVTSGGSTYSTTYGTTYTTAVAVSTIVPVTSTGTESSSSAAATQTKAGGADNVKVGSGVLGAAAVVAWALL